jgi:hypothetical protein
LPPLQRRPSRPSSHPSFFLAQNFFLAAGSVSEPAARLIAELLGFDPDLVMPQLDLARAAEAAAQQARRAAAAEGQ